MSDYSSLKATINANVKANNNHEITGSIMNSVLNAMVNSLGAGYQYMGLATPTNPGTAQSPDYKCFYLATTPGTYTNLGGLVVADGEVAILKYDSSWTKEVTGIASADKLNQLNRNVVGDRNIYKCVLNNPGFLLSSNGQISENSNFAVSDFIRVNEGDVIVYNGWIAENPAVLAMGCYDSNMNYLPDESVSPTGGVMERQFTIPAGVSYIRICARVADGGFEYCYLQNENAKNIITTNERIDAVIGEINSIFRSINLINPNLLTQGYYVLYDTGNLDRNPNFSVTDFIPVKPNTNYYFAGDCQHVFYDENKGYISGAHVTNGIITSPNNAAFLRVSARTEYVSNLWIVAESDFPIPFTPYSVVLDSKFLPKANESERKTGVLVSGGIVQMDTQFIRRDCVLSATLKFTGAFNVRLGRGPINQLYAFWVEIGASSIIIKYNQSGSTIVVDTIAHGLTLSDCVNVSLVCGKDKATIALSTNSGFFISDPFTWFGGGCPFITNLGGDTLNYDLVFSPRGCKFDIRIYQDSYGNYWQNWMWPYYVLERGYENWLGDNLTGANSATMFDAFGKDLGFGTPKFAVWALGMNDGADSNNTTPNQTWLNYAEKFKETCDEYGIIPIFCTIPSVPSKLHSGKNYWIKNVSGCRYIDLADAVGANDNGVWYSGMINADNVHPSVLGAKVLANRVIIDFPEITGLK